jgi:hypothetical protein
MHLVLNGPFYLFMRRTIHGVYKSNPPGRKTGFSDKRLLPIGLLRLFSTSNKLPICPLGSKETVAIGQH